MGGAVRAAGGVFECEGGVKRVTRQHSEGWRGAVGGVTGFAGRFGEQRDYPLMAGEVGGYVGPDDGWSVCAGGERGN